MRGWLVVGRRHALFIFCFLLYALHRGSLVIAFADWISVHRCSSSFSSRCFVFFLSVCSFTCTAASEPENETIHTCFYYHYCLLFLQTAALTLLFAFSLFWISSVYVHQPPQIKALERQERREKRQRDLIFFQEMEHNIRTALKRGQLIPGLSRQDPFKLRAIPDEPIFVEREKFLLKQQQQQQRQQPQPQQQLASSSSSCSTTTATTLSRPSSSVATATNQHDSHKNKNNHMPPARIRTISAMDERILGNAMKAQAQAVAHEDDYDYKKQTQSATTTTTTTTTSIGSSDAQEFGGFGDSSNNNMELSSDESDGEYHSQKYQNQNQSSADGPPQSFPQVQTQQQQQVSSSQSTATTTNGSSAPSTSSKNAIAGSALSSPPSTTTTKTTRRPPLPLSRGISSSSVTSSTSGSNKQGKNKNDKKIVSKQSKTTIAYSSQDSLDLSPDDKTAEKKHQQQPADMFIAFSPEAEHDLKGELFLGEDYFSPDDDDNTAPRERALTTKNSNNKNTKLLHPELSAAGSGLTTATSNTTTTTSTHVRRNTGNTIFVKTTMTNPDIDATIKCVCGVYRAHVVQGAERLANQQRSPVSVHTVHLNLDIFCDDYEEPVGSSQPPSRRNSSKASKATSAASSSSSSRRRRTGPAAVVPMMKDIEDFYHEFYMRSQMEHDTIIMSLIYVERLIKETQCALSPTPENWRSLLFSCMILASKVWDDLSMWNVDFSNVSSSRSSAGGTSGAGGASSSSSSSSSLTPFSLRRINDLEVALLTSLNFDVKVGASEYAKYYFLIRTMLIRGGLLEHAVAPLNKQEAKMLEHRTSIYQNMLEGGAHSAVHEESARRSHSVDWGSLSAVSGATTDNHNTNNGNASSLVVGQPQQYDQNHAHQHAHAIPVGPVLKDQVCLEQLIPMTNH
jgi:Cyclin, N-terminal domain